MESPFREITLGEEIFSELNSNEYLHEIYENILFNYSLRLFRLENAVKKEEYLDDALRFADLLSKSVGTKNADRHKIWAQEIVALLHYIHPNNKKIIYYMGTVLSNVGNFRGLSKMVPSYKEASIINRLFAEYNMDYLTIPADPAERFFPAQKKMYDNFDKDYFSYSAPTSMGKSFIMRMFIKKQVIDGKKLNFAIIVPTKALINEVSGEAIDDLKELLEEKDYRIVTSSNDVAMNKKHNYIFVITPERLLYLLIEQPDLKLDYIFIDEAHKISSKDKRSTFYYQSVEILYEREHRPHIIFASPNIPNPEVYLELIPNAELLSGNKFASSFAPVSQIKYVIDFVDLTAHVYNSYKREYMHLTNLKSNTRLEHIVAYVGQMAQNIVYCSSTNNAVQFARDYAKTQKPIMSKKLEVLAKDIRKKVHNDYYLADLIELGVAYHIGYLPADIRLRLEEYYRDGLIKTIFCTSTLIEGVNLPADNLFITSYKSGIANFKDVDFKNLMGRVGRIKYNLYGNVFITRLEDNLKKGKFQELVEKDIPRQQLSVVTELKRGHKKLIVDTLLSGSVEFARYGKQSGDEYDLMRKFALILVRDIVKDRNSRVRHEFAEFLDDEKTAKIKDLFDNKPIKPDDDINISIDQTINLVNAISRGLKYPDFDIEKGADYSKVIDFMEKLCIIFKWEKYEKNTLGHVNKYGNHGQLAWYVVILLQWIHGYGLNNILEQAIEDKKKNNRDVKVGFYEWEPYDGTVRHKNFIIAESLEAIEEVILFRISNYFLKFSEEYKKQHNVKNFDNDWYEYVEYGTTNKLRITLQRCGFTREASHYIRSHTLEYVVYDGNEPRLKKTILDCPDDITQKDARKIQYNVPELFIGS